MKTFQKHPEAVKNYTVNWSSFLGTDTISTSTWEADSGITIDSDTNDTTSATVWLSGGTQENTYCITNKIVTVAGVTDLKSIHIRVDECEENTGDY